MLGLNLMMGLGGGQAVPPPSYSPEAEAFFARMTTPPDTARKAIINNLIVPLINAGVWPKFDLLYLNAGADSQAGRLNAVSSSYTAMAQNGPTFTPDRGYLGDGVGAYLTTGYAMNSGQFTQNSGHISIWSRTAAGTASALSGARTATTTSQAVIGNRTATDAFVHRVNISPNPANASITNGAGHFITSRTASNLTTLYHNGVSVHSYTNASTTVTAQAAFILAANQGGAPAAYQAIEVAAFSVGAGLSDAEAAAFSAALQTYMTAVGA